MSDGYDPDVVAGFELDIWNRCADRYLDTFAGITRETVPLLVSAGEIHSGNEVLEIGSGPGHVADMLVKTGASVTAIDFSLEMVQVARTRYPHITFKQADAEQLPFDDESFDVVVANYVVHHLARPEIVFREVHRVLRPHGRFAFAVWGAPEEQSSIGAFFGAVEAHLDLGDLPRGPLFGVTESRVYEPILNQAGLKRCRLQAHEVKWETETMDPVIRGFWDYGNMASLPKELQDKIEASTCENAQQYEQNGRFVFPHSALVGSAFKP